MDPDGSQPHRDGGTTSAGPEEPPAAAAPMGELERLLAERACERLMLRYARLVDGGHASGIADLFTDEGEWMGADGRAMHGREAIRSAFGAREAVTRRQSRHVITNLLVEVEGPERASGVAYLINFRHDASGTVAAHPAPANHPKFVGDYHLAFHRVEGRWLIDRLRFDLVFLRQRRAP
jgi:ketosteroid isomerase-like protein